MANVNYTTLHVWSFGAALGIIWGISVLLIALVAMFFGLGMGFVETLRTVYLGYEATFLGSIIGGIWGFFDMFIGGVIFAALYNLFVKKINKESK